MMLKDYLNENGITIVDFAKQAGFSREYIGLLMANKRKIRERSAKIIAGYTNGQVTVEEILSHNKGEDPRYKKPKKNTGTK